jgi:predicted transcriptional regulator
MGDKLIYIHEEKKFLSAAECDAIIKLGSSIPTEEPQKLPDVEWIDRTGRESAESAPRQGERTYIYADDDSDVVKNLWKKVKTFIYSMNDKIWEFNIDEMFYRAEYCDYQTGDFFAKHLDDAGGDWVHNKFPVFGCSIILNDRKEWEGGDLAFPPAEYIVGRDGEVMKHEYEGYVTDQRRGSLYLYPTAFWHEVTPITSGSRKCLVLWALSHPHEEPQEAGA